VFLIEGVLVGVFFCVGVGGWFLVFGYLGGGGGLGLGGVLCVFSVFVFSRWSGVGVSVGEWGGVNGVPVGGPVSQAKHERGTGSRGADATALLAKGATEDGTPVGSGECQEGQCADVAGDSMGSPRAGMEM